jgi:preprotein translocase SecE subunit
MAVAVKTGNETAPRSLLPQHLAVSSILGGLYVLFSVGMVLTGLPVLWNDVFEINQILNVFLSDALLMIVLIVAAIVFVVVGRLLEGPHPPRGQRAGAILAAVGLFFIGLLTLAVGNWLSTQDAWIQNLFTGVVGVALVAGLAWLFFRPGFVRWLVHVEEQGWFHASTFKPNQGLRVRRGTVVALLVLVACGFFTMLGHNTFGRGDWIMDMPGDPTRYVPILLNVHYTMPLILVVVLGWFSWRVVNWPVFADFLIATEAEMNKVSWTTRKRLWQDTIVVLVTVILLTVFLFVVDVLWIKVLSAPFIRVLQIDPMQEQAKRAESQQW